MPAQALRRPRVIRFSSELAAPGILVPTGWFCAFPVCPVPPWMPLQQIKQCGRVQVSMLRSHEQRHWLVRYDQDEGPEATKALGTKTMAQDGSKADSGAEGLAPAPEASCHLLLDPRGRTRYTLPACLSVCLRLVTLRVHPGRKQPSEIPSTE